MVSEVIDISVRERGSRIVRRQLTHIGDSALSSDRHLRQLQKGLFLIGSAAALRGISRVLDTLTNFENRINLVTDSQKELITVEKELFSISARSRTAYSTTAEIYARTALAVKDLGISQRETLQFTESLNKATILSGAQLREQTAALIQLSQGLASNRLSGDELRSVLEQLPYVAGIIASELNIARGELRKFGSEGKISAEKVLAAFRNAREEIDERFGQTIPTIGQSFAVLKVQALQVVDGFDDMTGSGALVANSIIALAGSLDLLAVSAISAIAAFASFKIAGFIGSIGKAISENKRLAAGLRAGTLVLRSRVELEAVMAGTILKRSQAVSASFPAQLKEIQLNNIHLGQLVAQIKLQQSQITIDKQKRRARDALTGRFIFFNQAVEQNIRTNRALRLTEGLIAKGKIELTTALAAQTVATKALTAAETRYGVAIAATQTRTARLARIFPILSDEILIASKAFQRLFGVIGRNPFGSIAAAITASGIGLVYFSDRIDVTADGVVKLRDVFFAVFQVIGIAISSVTSLLSTQFSLAYKLIEDDVKRIGVSFRKALGGLVSYTKIVINQIIGIFVGGFNAIVASWGFLPIAFERIGVLAVNSLLIVIDAGIEGLVRSIGGFLSFLGQAFTAVNLTNPFAGLLEDFDINLERFQREVPQSFEDVGKVAADKFLDGFRRDYLGDAYSSLLSRARTIAEKRTADLEEKRKRNDRDVFTRALDGLTKENELLQVNTASRKSLSAILKIEKDIKRDLSDTERSLVEALVHKNTVLQRASDIFDAINTPAEKYKITLEALDVLLKKGRISQDEFTSSVRKTRVEFLDTQKDLASGFERGFLKIIDTTADAANQAEKIVTKAFDGMSSAIADLVVDGKADFGSLIQSINKEIVKLVVSQAFQQLFKSTVGGGSGDGSNFLGSLLGFQKGGSFTVGNGFTSIPNGGIDNRLVAFRAQDGEKVTVTPRGKTQGEQGAQHNTFTFNITTPDAQSFQKSQSQIAAKAAQIVSAGNRNR
jgi:lambda family phage tail tape measure protein